MSVPVSASLLAISLTMGFTVLTAAGQVSLHTHARSVADSAALAAANSNYLGQTRAPCDVANQVAAANQTHMVSCEVTENFDEFYVHVQIAPHNGIPGLLARAKAGW